MPITLMQDNPLMPEELRAIVGTENIKTLNSKLGSQGVNLLFSKIVTERIDWTDSTLKPFNPFTATVTTSGGLVDISCTISGQNNAQTNTMQLVIDGQTKLVRVSGFSIQVQTSVTMRWIGSLAPGQHSINVNLSSVNPNWVINYLGQTSEMFVAEYLV